MKFGEAIASVLNKYATFQGRARRSEYWYFFLFNVIISSILSWLAQRIGFFWLISVLYTLALFLPGLAVTCRRLHDSGKSGGWIFICLVPLVGTIILLVFLARDGQPGPNAYGPDPREAPGGTEGRAPWEY